MADPAQDWTKEFEPLEQARENAPPDDQAIMQGATKRLQERHTKDGVLDVGAFQRAARMQLRGINQVSDSDFQPLPQLGSLEEAASLPPGTNFIGPDGAKRVVPYKAESLEAINDVPDGAHFIGPDGNLRQKPKFEPIDVTSQYLYDVAHSDKGRKKALERAYPGKVRDDPSGGFYIEDDNGTFRKPGRGAAATGGGLAASAAPGLMSAGGATLGGMAGGRMGLLTGAAGGFAGGYAGSKANDIMSSLAQVYDPEGAEEGALKEGVFGAGGALLGPAIAGTGRLIKTGVEKGKSFLPGLANKALGTDPEKLRLAREMAERGAKPGSGPIGQFFEEPGTMVPPSQPFPEAPALHNIVEVKEPALHTQKPLRKSAEQHYERGVGELLEGLGVGKPMTRAQIDKSFAEMVTAHEAGDTVRAAELEQQIAHASTRSATHPTAGVAVEEAGNVILEAKRARLAESDKRAAELLELRKADAQRRAAVSGEANAARTNELRAVQEAAQRDAQALIDQGFADLDRQSKDALKVAGAGHNTGELWRSVGEQLGKYRAGIQSRAKIMYDTADELSGGAKPDLGNLGDKANAFLKELPEEFEKNHLNIVARIRQMASKEDESAYDMLADIRGQDPYGEVIKANTPTWSQLHDLRTQLRQNIKWNDLTSDVKNGTYKFFQNRIDEILHAGGTPELKEASAALRRADAFYKQNMGPLENRQIQSVMDGLKSGLTADPKMLLDLIMKEGRTEVAQKIKSVVGENTWNALRAADTQEMLTISRDLNGAIDSRKFAREVLKRQNQGLLDTLHGEAGSQRIVEQARRVEQLAGRLPINAQPGDTVSDVIMRARAAADAATKAAEDPIKALNKEIGQIVKTHKADMAAAKQNDPLAFMMDPTVGAHAAVDKILSHPDMLIASSRAFPGGENSPEFQLIRQIYAERFLRGDMYGLSGKLADKALTPEIQALMFPGVTVKQMHLLAKEMDLLQSKASGQFGNSLMGTNIQEHPIGAATGLGKLAGPAKMIPGANMGARVALGNYYALVRKVMTSPTTLRWLEKGLTSPDPAGREAARAELRKLMQQGRAVGAGTGAGLGSTVPQEGGNE